MLAKTGLEAFSLPPSAPFNCQVPMSVAVWCCRDLQKNESAGDAMDFLQRLGHIFRREVFQTVSGRHGLKRCVLERQFEH